MINSPPPARHMPDLDSARRAKSPRSPESARLGRWVRVYASDLDDFARQSLSDPLYRTLDDLERLAGGHDGVLTIELIMFHIRYLSAAKEAEKRISALADAGFVIRDGQSIRLRDWNVRQYKSDSSTPRVQELRAREREEKERQETEHRAAETAHETPDATLRETLQETFRETPPQRRGNDPPTVSETAAETPLQRIRDTDRSSSSVGTKPRARERADDDDLRRKLNEAANGRIASNCTNVSPIRKLLAEGVPLEAVISCFKNNVAHLRRPLQTFGAEFIAIEASAHAEAMAAAEARRGDAVKAIELVFVPLDAPHWPAVEARYVRERGRQPPRDSRNPDGANSFGWQFPTSWPECHPDVHREAAE
jgi:hypothetical protein